MVNEQVDLKRQSDKITPAGYIDLNIILRVVTLVLTGSTWYVFHHRGESEYINKMTLWLATFLAAQILYFLYREAQRRDPFVLILCFQLIFFYILRVLTLTLYPFSLVFLRYGFSPDQLNYAILFILCANFALYLGFSLNDIPIYKAQQKSKTIPYKMYGVIGALFFVYFMTYSVAIGNSVISALVSVLNALFINVAIVMFMIAIYYVIFYKELNKVQRFYLLGGLFIYIVISTISGSRSAFITLGYFFLLAMITVYHKVLFKKVHLIAIGLMVPALVILFTIATFLRPRLENRADVSGETVEILKEFSLSETIEADKEIILAPIFDRIGFLDFCAEVIGNRDKYAFVFTPSFYGASIIDNVFTPGFDIFDKPKASNALTFIYNDFGEPKKSKVTEYYQSDEFTLYGEMFVLFGGWVSLLPIFLVAFIFKRLYVKVSDTNKFRFYVKRCFILYVFFTFLNSFGLDWLLFDIVSIIFTFIIFKSFFKFKADKTWNEAYS